MDLTRRVRRWATAKPRVLIVDAPGSARLRWQVEAELAGRGWAEALAPAGADLLLVLGSPGPQLDAALELLWSQIARPAHRCSLLSGDGMTAALDAAAAALGELSAYDPPFATPAELLAGGGSSTDADPGQEMSGMSGHSGHTMPGHDMSSHSGHNMPEHNMPGHDMSSHSGHNMPEHNMPGHDMSAMSGHSAHMHHGGDVAGLAMAMTAPDRDGLELDELRVTLGPVLPAWPTGLVLRASLQGDLLSAAELSWADEGTEVRATQNEPTPAVALDLLADFLLLAGWPRAARLARSARNEGAFNDSAQPPATARALCLTVRRSRVLAWSVRGLGLTGTVETGTQDVWDRVLLLCQIGAGEASASTALPGILPAELAAMLIGVELAQARLILASFHVENTEALVAGSNR